MRSILEDAIVARLVPGRTERYELPDEEVPYLAMLYRRVASLPTARGELFRAVQIEVALEETLASPTAANRLRALRDTIPEVVDGVKRRLARLEAAQCSIDRARRFALSEGRAVVLRAPHFSTDPGRN